jgi:hypothetical protein
MSYLHGPLTRPQIQALMKKRKEQLGASPAADTQAAFTAQATPVVKDSAPPPGYSLTRQVLAPEIPQLFLPVTANETLAIHQAYRRAKTHIELEQAQLVYEPAIIGSASVRFLDQKQNISQERERLLLTGIPGQLDSVDWDRAVSLSIPLGNLRPEPEQVASGQGPFFAAVPEGANSPAELKSIASAFADWLYYNSEIKLLAHPELNVIQHPEESEQQFKARLRQAARELRDAGVDKLRNRYEDRIEKLEARLRRYERDLEQDEADYHARKRESLIATGEMMLTLFSKRRGYRTFSWTASRRRMANRAKMEVEETEAEINEIETELADLQNELNQQIEAITPRWVDILKKITAHTVRPRRADVDVKLVGLAWVPLWVIRYSADGKSLSTTIPAYAIDSN